VALERPLAQSPSPPGGVLYNFRKLLQKAQTAEVEGNHAEAISCLRLAATLCQQAGLKAKAQKMLRHLSRLEAHSRAPLPPGINAPAPCPPTCMLCEGEAQGGWQAKGGKWLCKACLQQAKAATEDI